MFSRDVQGAVVGVIVVPSIAALAAPALARIVIGFRIGPVRLGQTRAQVIHELGPADKTVKFQAQGSQLSWHHGPVTQVGIDGAASASS